MKIIHCGHCHEEMEVIKNKDGTTRLERKEFLNCPYLATVSCSEVALLIQENDELKKRLAGGVEIAK